MRLFGNRIPGGGRGPAWCRLVGETTITYRLYRRDYRNATHCSIVTFSKTTPSDEIAATLKKKRRALRDKVDELDLAGRYGVTA